MGEKYAVKPRDEKISPIPSLSAFGIQDSFLGGTATMITGDRFTV
jgi:hypothetical protein